MGAVAELEPGLWASMTEAELVERWTGYAYALAEDFFLPGADRDDLRQESLIGLLNAIRDYDPALGAFKSFVILCVKRHLYTAVKGADRVKHRLLTGAVREFVLEDERVEAVDSIVDLRSDPQRTLEARETLAEVLDVLPRLSPFEAKCLIGFAVGAKYCELNDRPVYDKAAVGRVDNAYNRALRKLAA